MFTDATDSACGFAQAASGPFYCPGDEKVYMDLGFFREMQRQLGAPGDFARGYVVPDAFTHGTSKQRVDWFNLGLQTGDLSKGDTFSADID
jgi:predicted metalloprotease